MYKTLLTHTDGAVTTIRFNRPDSLNAISRTTLEEFGNALDEVANDSTTRALILTGEGPKAFVAGADISEMASMSALELRNFSIRAHETLFQLEKLSIPVIACVNGYALGGGLEIAMACDFIYAADTAKLGQPEISIGLIPGWGGTQRLSRIVGKGLAKEICMTGEMLDAHKAKQLGIVNEVFAADELYDATMATAKKISSMSRIATTAVKNCIDSGFDLDLRSACHLESDAFGYCVAGKDGAEGMKAFLEKRSPQYKDA